MDRADNIIITGFMGTGKTTVGRLVAAKLQRPFVDMDARIEAEAGRTIQEIFSEQGETMFRSLEAQLCREFATPRGQVIATGGGALLAPTSRKLLLRSCWVCCLRCDLVEILRRLDQVVDRPLLPRERRESSTGRLLAEREAVYSEIPWQVDTTDRSPEQVAEDIISLWQIRSTGVHAEPAPYSVYTGAGLRHRIGGLLRSVTGRSSIPVCLVAGPTVGDLYGADVERSLRSAGFDPHICMIPDGESAKTLVTVRALYDQFVSAGLDRSGAVIGLGGGVTGDLAGFAAATFNRGVRWLVHIPTTLVAMIDASLGGKTGVDLPQGKNLVGAFFHPSLVAADTEVLRTLPTEELRNGTAEALKHGVIASPDLFRRLAAQSFRATDWTAGDGVDLIARAQEVKVRLIEEDPCERGRRIFLNLGHTVGHALENASHYKVRHGEAVAVGLIACAHLSARLGLASETLIEEIAAALERSGLPTRCPPYSVDALLRMMATDKKRDGGSLRWVLPRSIGTVETVTVPVSDVRQTLVALGAKEIPE